VPGQLAVQSRAVFSLSEGGPGSSVEQAAKQVGRSTKNGKGKRRKVIISAAGRVYHSIPPRATRPQ
jgi:hypothetical protein